MTHPRFTLFFSLFALLFALSQSLIAAPQFVAPTSNQRQEAVGNLSPIPPDLRPLFLDTTNFAPIPTPGPLDWLATREEPGQTYPQFYTSNFNVPTREQSTLYLQPIGETKLSPEDTTLLVNYCKVFFNTPVTVLPPLSLEPDQVRNRINEYTQAPQLHAADTLKVLHQNRPIDAYAIIGFTLTDLYPDESWNFVFGLANLRQSVGVFSFARYGDPATDHQQFVERALKVMSHEIGHMYGLQHCIYYHCLMNGSNGLEETDRAPMNLCPVCLRKLHEATQPDHLTRYAQLKKIYQTQSLQPSAAFTRKRLVHLLDATATP